MVRMTPGFLLAVAVLVFGQDARTPSADPVSDRLRFEIASAQRDYLDAELRLIRAQNQFLAKTAEAQKACTAEDKAWDADSFSCQKAGRQ